jgi:secreted trypsin-like serine protease
LQQLLFRVLPILALAPATACQISNRDVETTNVKVVDGEFAPAGSMPSVFSFSAGGLNCTGAKVSERIILTAAHCIMSPERDELLPFLQQNRIIFESFNATSAQDAYDISVVEARIHPSYAKLLASFGERNLSMLSEEGAKLLEESAFDLALILTQTTVPAETAEISFATMRPGEEVMLTGFGCVSVGGGRNAQVSYAPAKVRAVSNFYFAAAGAEKQRSCSGDSGGPVFELVDRHEDGRLFPYKLGRIVGVNSATENASEDPFSLHTRLDGEGVYDGKSVAAWLRETISEFEAAPVTPQ